MWKTTTQTFVKSNSYGLFFLPTKVRFNQVNLRVVKQTNNVNYPQPLSFTNNMTFPNKQYFEGEDLMNMMDQVARKMKDVTEKPKCKQVLNTYRTESHVQIYRFLASVMNQLQHNEYKDCRGLNSHTLIGRRGIGKTATLTNISLAGQLLFPKIIPIYISYLGIQNDPFLQQHTVMEVVEMVLNEQGIPVDTLGGRFVNIMEALFEADKHVLLIVDEIDKLYQVCPNGWSDNLIKSLGELASIGDNDSGRFAAILCGSSSRISLLVNANGKKDEVTVNEFPLVATSPNLNGNKFRVRRILTNPPTDITVAAYILESGLVNTKNKAMCKAVTFITGGVTREIQRLQSERRDETFFTSLHVESNPKALATLSSPGPEIWNNILALLFEKNK